MKDSRKALPGPKSLIPYRAILQGQNGKALQGYDTNEDENDGGNERLPIDRESLMTHGIAAVMGFAISMLFYLNGSNAVLNGTAMVIMFMTGVMCGGFIAVRFFKIKLKKFGGAQ